MVHIFRHKENKRLYTLEHLIRDIYHANCGINCGIYATPYGWKGDAIMHTLSMEIDGDIDCFEPEEFVEDNFEVECELY